MNEPLRLQANLLHQNIQNLGDLIETIDPEKFCLGDGSSTNITVQQNLKYARVNGSYDVRNADLEKFLIDNTKEVMTIAWTLLKPRLEAKLEALKAEYEAL